MRKTIPDSVVPFFTFIAGPQAPGNCGFPFSARSRNFSSCQRPSEAKMAGNPRISRFPARGGPVGQNVNCKKVADNYPGQRRNFPPRFRTPSTGKLCFSCFPTAPGITVSAPGPKWAEIPLNHPFRPVGVSPQKSCSPRKLRKTVPDSVVTFFSLIS